MLEAGLSVSRDILGAPHQPLAQSGRAAPAWGGRQSPGPAAPEAATLHLCRVGRRTPLSFTRGLCHSKPCPARGPGSVNVAVILLMLWACLGEESCPARQLQDNDTSSVTVHQSPTQHASASGAQERRKGKVRYGAMPPSPTVFSIFLFANSGTWIKSPGKRSGLRKRKNESKA